MLDNNVATYHQQFENKYQEICIKLLAIIQTHLSGANSKIWHSHPVWFIDDNPIVGYSLQKKGVRLMFWSGADFQEPALNVLGKKFKDASIFYNNSNEIDEELLINCLRKAISIQWDYKNIVKRKGELIKLT